MLYRVSKPILSNLAFVLVAAATSVIVTNAAAQNNAQRTYQVSVTNISKGNVFTPVLAASHRSGVALFKLGEKASDALGALAEGGATAPLRTALDAMPNRVSATTVTAGPLFAGATVEFEIRGDARGEYFSMAAMILPTNDSFVALDSVPLPKKGSSTFYALGFDAGSEVNDESCASIPGPFGCDGTGDGAFTAVDGEGFVFVSNGIHGVGDLSPEIYDWRNPMAKVTITRTR